MSAHHSLAFARDRNRFHLDEWIFQQASYYRAQNTEAADWLAEILEKIAHQIPADATTQRLRAYVALGWDYDGNNHNPQCRCR